MGDLYAPTPSQHVFPEARGELFDGPVRLSNGSTAILTLDGVLRLWTPAGEPLEPVPVSSVFPAVELAVVFDRDGRELVACVIYEFEPPDVVLVDPATGELVTAEIVAGTRLPLDDPEYLPAPVGPSSSLCQLNDTEIVTNHQGDATAHIWNVQTRRRTRSIPDFGHCLTRMGNLVAAAYQGAVRFWDSTASQVGEPVGVHGGIHALQGFDSHLAIADYDGIQVWDSSRLSTLTTQRAFRLAGVPGQPVLLSGDVDDVIRRWNLVTGEQIAIETGTPHVMFTVAGGMIVSAAEGSSDLALWDLESGSPLGTIPGLEPECGTAFVTAVGDLVAQSRLDGLVQLWDPVTRMPVGEFLAGHVYERWGHGAPVHVLPHNDSLITAGCDGTIRRWPRP